MLDVYVGVFGRSIDYSAKLLISQIKIMMPE